MKQRKCQLINNTIWVSIPKHICDDMDIQKNTVLECNRKGNKIIYEKLDSNNHENTNSTLEEHESGTDD